jgi:hypothetical protein
LDVLAAIHVLQLGEAQSRIKRDRINIAFQDKVRNGGIRNTCIISNWGASPYDHILDSPLTVHTIHSYLSL